MAGFALLSMLPLMPRKLSSLTVTELAGIRDAMGFDFKVNVEIRDAAMAMLQGQSLDTVADLVKSPEAVAELVTFLQGGFKAVAAKPKLAVVRSQSVSDEEDGFDFPPIQFL